MSTFPKSVEKIQVSLTSDKKNGHFTPSPIYIFIISSTILLVMKNVLDKSCGENQTDLMLGNVLKKIVPFMRNVEKYSRTGDAK
jgi:hypothetical protein